MNENPYASPETVGAITSEATEADFRDIFVGWEWLRLWYNGVLTAFSLLLGARWIIEPEFWESALLGAIAANVCYCIGPIVESYATLMLRRRVKALRYALFAVGTLLSMLVVFSVFFTVGLARALGD